MDGIAHLGQRFDEIRFCCNGNAYHKIFSVLVITKKIQSNSRESFKILPSMQTWRKGNTSKRPAPPMDCHPILGLIAFTIRKRSNRPEPAL